MMRTLALIEQARRHAITFDIPADKTQVDALLHLRLVPLGRLFCKWREAQTFGHLPHMATHSRASVGSFLASSFSERINSGGKMTFNESNVNLSEEYLDIRTTLRMNKDFMRTHYPHIAA